MYCTNKDEEVQKAHNRKLCRCIFVNFPILNFKAKNHSISPFSQNLIDFGFVFNFRTAINRGW